MAANSKQSPLVPDLPRTPQVVDKEGNLTSEWKLYFDQITQALQQNLTPEGFVMPQQNASNIALLTSAASLANILYDTTNNVFKGNVLTAPNTYTWKTFTLV